MKHKREGGKKFLAFLLSAVMVSQMYAMPVQSAFASQEGADGLSVNEGSAVAGDTDDQALRSDSYNGAADFREIASGISVTVYKDAAMDEPLGDEPVVDGAHLYGKLNIDFAEKEQPTLESPNIKYVFPNNVNFTNKGEQPLYDSSNNVAGTWRIENGVAYLHYNEDWLRTHPSGCTAYVGFDFSVQESGKGDGDQVIINFPGTGTSVTVNIKDGDVAGSKFGANPSKEWEMPTFDPTDNTYTWTVKVSPQTIAHDLKIYDIIGSNLEFVGGSFTLVDKDGNPVSGTCDASVDGKEATISLGTLTKGDYYVQYKTKVKQSALDALKDGENLSDVGNSVRWTWGTSYQQEGQSSPVYPQTAKYSMVSKYAADGSVNENINWTVKLNTGTLKADMSGYVFTDTLDAGQKFKAGTQYTVTDAAGKVVAAGRVDPSSNKLSFTLPANLGKQELTVTYATEMADPASSKSVSNTATVTPSNGTGVGGGATATYQPSDSRTYISKELVQEGNAENGGKASWTSTVYFSAMESDTDPGKVVFSDGIRKDTWQQIKFSDVVLKVAGTGQTLTAGTDYEITNDGQWNDLQITFKSSELTRSLIGTGNVVVSYNTDCGTGAGTYTNTSSVVIDNVKKGEAKASYEVKAEAKAPFTKKSSGNAWWKADYVWADGTKGAWIADWTIHANCDEPNDWTHNAAGDLKGADVVIKDTLGEGMEYVAGSSRYWLRAANGFTPAGDWPTLTAEPATDGNVATFTIPTSSVVNGEGSWNGYVELKYQTAIKPSAVEPGETREFSNTAEGSAGEKSFPAVTATTSVANKVLDKQAQRASDGSHVTYTISVNPNAQTIGDADTLTLTDTMSAAASFTKGTLSVKDAAGNELTDGVSYALKNKANDDGSTSTVLTITVPNSKALKITYNAAPQGAVGDVVEISNNVVVEGYASSAARHSQKWTVNKSNAGTDATSYGITISKANDGGNIALEGAEFELYQVDLDASTPGNLVKSRVETAGANPKATDASGLVSFGDKDNPLASNTLYCFVETKAPAGYKISNTEPTYVMFSGTSAQDKKDYAAALAKAKALGITPNAGTSFNVFDEKSDQPEVAPTSVSLAARKVLTGRALTEGEFSFELKDASGNVLQTKTNAADGSVAFDAIKYSQAGDFDYTISEVTKTGAEAKGVTYDGRQVAVHVSVKQDPGSGELSATVSYDGEDETPVFTNSYAAKGGLVLRASKTLEGRDLKAGEFKFEVREGGRVVATGTSDASGAVVFSELTYTEAGSHKYEVTEVAGVDKNITYSEAKYTVDVEVADNGDGTLTATPTVEGGKALEFGNKFTPDAASVALSAKKDLTGRALTEGEFSFQVKEGETVVATASNDAAGNVSFPQISYTAPGEHDYTISEVAGGEVGMAYDSATYKAHVSVTQDASTGLLSAEATYENGGLPIFRNTYSQASGEFQLSVAKTVNGGAPKAGETFGFSASAEGENADSAPALADVTTDPEGKATFVPALLADKDAGKTYTYRIHETGDLADGWTRAADVIATVTVSGRTADNKLTAKVSYKQDAAGAEAYEGAAKFDNTFSASTAAVVAVSKKVTGGTSAVAGEAFEFELLGKDGSKVEGVDNVKVQAGGTAEFTGLKYTTADAGKTFDYTVHEIGHNTNGWTAASDVEATVKVTERADRSLAAEVSYGRGTNSAEFTNTYATSGEATFGVYKTVNGGTEAKPGEVFSFELYEADQIGNKTGEALDKVETAAGQVKDFSSRKFTSEGTYKFVIHETGHNDKGWTAASDVLVTVVATDNGNGTLKLKTTYSRSAEGVAGFDDTYAASGEATIKVSKTVNGGSDAKEGEFFEFELLDKGGNKVEGVDNVKVQAGGTAEFTGLKYSFADAGKKIEYTVHEVGHNSNGWTAASDVPVSVEVSDNGNGTLSTKASYPGDAVAAEFDNIYEVVPATAAPSVLKTVKTNDGRAWQMQAGQFSFELCDATGRVLQTKFNDANGAAGFDPLSFGAPGTYTYQVREGAVCAPLAQTIERDATVYTVTYVVGEKNDGTENARDLEVKSATVKSSSAIDVDADEGADQGLSFVNVEKPGVPEQPAAPKAPEAPKGSDASTGTGAAKSGKTPQTGDVTSNVLSVAAATVGLAFMAATLHRRRED